MTVGVGLMTPPSRLQKGRSDDAWCVPLAPPTCTFNAYRRAWGIPESQNESQARTSTLPGKAAAHPGSACKSRSLQSWAPDLCCSHSGRDHPGLIL